MWKVAFKYENRTFTSEHEISEAFDGSVFCLNTIANGLYYEHYIGWAGNEIEMK
jgi:hypothetical protein